MAYSSLWPGWNQAAKRDLSNLAAHPDTSKATKFPRGDGTWVSQYELGKVSVPASATATGTTGQWALDTDYIYHCVATDTWARIPLNSW